MKNNILTNLIWLIFLVPPIVSVLSGSMGIVPEQLANLISTFPILLIGSYLLLFHASNIKFRCFEIVFLASVGAFALNGLLNGSSLLYITKDLAVLLVGPAAFSLGRCCAGLRPGTAELFKSSARRWGLVLFALFATFPISITHLLIFLKKKIDTENLLVASALIINTALVSSKSIVLVAIVWVFLVGGWVRKLKIIAIATIAFYVVATFLSSSDLPVVKKSLAFYEAFSIQELLLIIKNIDLDGVWIFDLSTGQRLYELLLVVSDMNVNTFIFGHGLGYAVDMSGSQDLSVAARTTETSIENVRSFHLIFTWLLAKAGGLGIVLVFAYFGFVFRFVRHNQILVALFAFFVSMTIVTFGGFSLNYPILFILGYLGSCAAPEILSPKGNAEAMRFTVAPPVNTTTNRV